MEKTGKKMVSTASTGAQSRRHGRLLNSSVRRKAAIWHLYLLRPWEDMFWTEWTYMVMIRYGSEVLIKMKSALGVGQIALFSISPHGEGNNQATGGMRTAWRWLEARTKESGMTSPVPTNVAFYAARGNAQVWRLWKKCSTIEHPMYHLKCMTFSNCRWQCWRLKRMDKCSGPSHRTYIEEKQTLRNPPHPHQRVENLLWAQATELRPSEMRPSSSSHNRWQDIQHWGPYSCPLDV